MSNWFDENFGILKVLKSIKNWILSVNPWLQKLLLPVYIIVLLVSGMLQVANNLFSTMLLKLNDVLAGMDIALPGIDSSAIASEMWAYANTFVPLDFALELLTLYFPLLIACSLLRIIKSFIPTIAS